MLSSAIEASSLAPYRSTGMILRIGKRAARRRSNAFRVTCTGVGVHHERSLVLGPVEADVGDRHLPQVRRAHRAAGVPAGAEVGGGDPGHSGIGRGWRGRSLRGGRPWGGRRRWPCRSGGRRRRCRRRLLQRRGRGRLRRDRRRGAVRRHRCRWGGVRVALRVVRVGRRFRRTTPAARSPTPPPARGDGTARRSAVASRPEYGAPDQREGSPRAVGRCSIGCRRGQTGGGRATVPVMRVSG